MFFDETSSLQTLIRRGFQTIRVPPKVEKATGTQIGTRMGGTLCIHLKEDLTQRVESEEYLKIKSTP
jgi:hypothetical protein